MMSKVVRLAAALALTASSLALAQDDQKIRSAVKGKVEAERKAKQDAKAASAKAEKAAAEKAKAEKAKAEKNAAKRKGRSSDAVRDAVKDQQQKK